MTSDERYMALRREREAIRAGRDPRGREAELIAEYLMQHRSSISTFGRTHRLVRQRTGQRRLQRRRRGDR